MKVRLLMVLWYYYFSRYSPARFIHFCMRSSQLSKHYFHSDWSTSKQWFLYASTACDENRWPRIFVL